MDKQANSRYGKSFKRSNLKKRLEEETVSSTKPAASKATTKPTSSTPTKVDNLSSKARGIPKSKLIKGLGLGAAAAGAAYGISKVVSKPKDMEKEAGVKSILNHIDRVLYDAPNKYRKTKDSISAGAKKLKDIKNPHVKAVASGAATGGLVGMASGNVVGSAEGRKKASDKFEKKAQSLPEVVKTRKGKTYEHAGNFSKDTKRKIDAIKNSIKSNKHLAGNAGKGVLLGGAALGTGLVAHKINKAVNKPFSESVETAKLKLTGHKLKKES